MKHYVYIHLNPQTKEVFYVGIGKGNRAWNRWAGRNNFWENYVNKYGFEVELIAENLTRKQAEKIEMQLIASLGRRQIDEGGTLVNRSSGGDGSKGYTHTEEFKRKLSEERKNDISKRMKNWICLNGNPNLKTYLLINFLGEYYIVDDGLIPFCNSELNLIHNNFKVSVPKD